MIQAADRAGNTVALRADMDAPAADGESGLPVMAP